MLVANSGHDELQERAREKVHGAVDVEELFDAESVACSGEVGAGDNNPVIITDASSWRTGVICLNCEAESAKSCGQHHQVHAPNESATGYAHATRRCLQMPRQRAPRRTSGGGATWERLKIRDLKVLATALLPDGLKNYQNYSPCPKSSPITPQHFTVA